MNDYLSRALSPFLFMRYLSACQLFLNHIILHCCQISETLIVKFTVITPESLDMSRMIMSVVSVAMGGEHGSSGGEGDGSASLVSNILRYLCLLSSNLYSHLNTELDQVTSFLSGTLTLFRSGMIMKAF